MSARPAASSLRLGAVILAVCVLLGLVETVQIRFGDGEVVETSWWVAMARVLPSWILLAGLSPVVVWASDRWPVRGEAWARSLVLHLVLSLPFALVHLALVTLWGYFRPGSLGLGFAAGLTWLASRYLVYAALSYGALVGVIHAFRYHQEVSAVREETRSII